MHFSTFDRHLAGFHLQRKYKFNQTRLCSVRTSQEQVAWFLIQKLPELGEEINLKRKAQRIPTKETTRPLAFSPR